MKNIRSAMLVSLLVIISLVCGCKEEKSDGGDKRHESLGKEPRIKLRLQLQPGTYEKVIRKVTESKDNLNSKPRNVKHSQTEWYEIVVSESDSTDQTICEVITKRLQSFGSSLGTFDTDNPDSLKDNKIAPLIFWQLNHKIVLKFDPNGEFISASGINEMYDELAQQMPSTAQFTNQMKETIGNGAEFLYGIASAMLPEEPVGVDAVWHRMTSKSMPIIGLTKYDHEIQLIKIESTPEGKIAHIKHVGLSQIQGGGDTNISSTSTNINNVDMKITGKIQINVDTGLLVNHKTMKEGEIKIFQKDSQDKDTIPYVRRFHSTTERMITPIEPDQ